VNSEPPSTGLTIQGLAKDGLVKCRKNVHRLGMLNMDRHNPNCLSFGRDFEVAAVDPFSRTHGLALDSPLSLIY
jgi:hypothetical protein